ncbi:MAG: hypothetical protein ACRDBO_11385 [Lachnospiraceae bacterium]
MAAVSQYKLWQRIKMGRDINPDELLKLIVAAGAKRAEILTPGFQVIDSEAVAGLNQEIVIYGGLEDD